MYEKMKARVNWPITILLFVGLLTVAFPLYMTIVIAFKQPSEMTNSISGILSLPAAVVLKQLRAGDGTDGFLAVAGQQPSGNSQHGCALHCSSFSDGICSRKK